MSLGYTIGPILRRTTTSYQAAPRGSDGGPVVKLDLLEMLGQFVQVCGCGCGCLRSGAAAGGGCVGAGTEGEGELEERDRWRAVWT
jgi:hypothetical protein